MYSYRVFVSYSHTDRAQAETVVAALEANGLTPLWDRSLTAGTGFSEQIQMFIAHAHVFVPLITATSCEGGWVHEEIGYAIAMNVPVLPVTVGPPPGGIIRTIQALRLQEDLGDVREKLSYERFDRLVHETMRQVNSPLFECAQDNTRRAILLADYANNVAAMDRLDRLRQKGGLSSFHIPNRRIGHQDWLDRYDDHPRSEYYCQCLRDERIALEKHAEAKGCRLLINPFSQNYVKYGPASRCARVNTLLHFLETAPDDKVSVALDPHMPLPDSIVMIGDWFSARSMSVRPGKGYVQTMFTRHAPTVRRQIQEFDEEFEELLEKNGLAEADSRQHAINALKQLVEELQPTPSDTESPEKEGEDGA